MDKPNVKTMSDEDLAELQKQTNEELERRRPRVALEDIKPGMSAETEEAARSELRDVLRRMGM